MPRRNTPDTALSSDSSRADSPLLADAALPRGGAVGSAVHGRRARHGGKNGLGGMPQPTFVIQTGGGKPKSKGGDEEEVTKIWDYVCMY